MIIKRIINVYKNQGLKKIILRAFYQSIYMMNNIIIRKKVERSRLTVESWKNKPIVEGLIISLTSYPKRFPYIGLCLKSLLLQSVRPEKIIVYLGSDSSPDNLTEEMIYFEKYGIEYRFDENENLKPHKKYYYAMKEFPNKAIVTADDDVIYPSDWLKSLYLSYKKYPYAISARRVHKIETDKNGKISPYNQWSHLYRNLRNPSNSLFATGASGCLYPPRLFDKEIFNTAYIKKYCLNADDIWLKCMEIRCNIPVVWVKNWSVEPVEIKQENNGLYLDNVLNNRNDKYFLDIRKIYGLEDKEFIDDCSH